MGIIIKTITRPILFAGAFGLGFAMFVRPWPITPLSKRSKPLPLTELKLYNDLESNAEFQGVIQDKKFKLIQVNELMPDAHKLNHVGQGLLNSPNHLDIGPLVFLNKSDGKMLAFTKLGAGLTGTDGKIHNGIISTLLDELLCFCGFSKLPNKRGVTASLNIDFINKADPGSIVVLRANVANFKGRKCIIDGDISDLNTNAKLATAQCILVEPKWFKYLKWVDLF